MSPIPLHRLISHVVRRRELDTFEALPQTEHLEKMARLEQVRRVNQMDLRVTPWLALIILVAVMPYSAIKLSDYILSFGSDALRDSVWFPLLVASITVILAVCCASFILVSYGNSLRELDYRTECLDENSPTSRLNASLSAAHRQIVQDKESHTPEHS
jgi:hypothetical protein